MFDLGKVSTLANDNHHANPEPYPLHPGGMTGNSPIASALGAGTQRCVSSEGTAEWVACPAWVSFSAQILPVSRCHLPEGHVPVDHPFGLGITLYRIPSPGRYRHTS